MSLPDCKLYLSLPISMVLKTLILGNELEYVECIFVSLLILTELSLVAKKSLGSYFPLIQFLRQCDVLVFVDNTLDCFIWFLLSPGSVLDTIPIVVV